MPRKAGNGGEQGAIPATAPAATAAPARREKSAKFYVAEIVDDGVGDAGMTLKLLDEVKDTGAGLKAIRNNPEGYSGKKLQVASLRLARAVKIAKTEQFVIEKA